MTAKHDLYSFVEICGKIQTQSKPEDLLTKPYYFFKLAFRDGYSNPKLINVFMWGDELKAKTFDMRPQNGDTVKVRGEIGYQERGDEVIHSVRAHEIEIVRRNPNTQPKVKAGLNF
jgi:exonuclease VII large subunit